jgi:putative flippase GtrA
LSLIRDTYSRFRVLLHEIAKFGVVGALGAVVQFGVQNVLHYKVALGPMTAVFIAYCAATCVTFVGNRYWAFRHRKGRGLAHESVTFVVLNVIGIGIQEGFVGLVKYGMGLENPIAFNAATVVGIGVATLFRLYSYRRFVFLAAPSGAAMEQLEPEAAS